ncbi:helix-turn-helix transcriptional regulator [Weissella cibaria]|uniref:helix-turn-helix domain-containing protein n=1 Tax=Weissella cibaria TaxID=137591 RepID=UPI001C1FB892|nr:helix-turn-helix transcriptional regulator [Weissella cibaria]MBU7561170.1 helix-turn-helix transcriptional regulator [Weissella cibaria]
MFPTNLKYLRERFGMDQLDLANRLGLKSSSSISMWEKGTSQPRVGTLSDIAELFDVPLSQLMNDDLSDSGVAVAPKLALTEVQEKIGRAVSSDLPDEYADKILEYIEALELLRQSRS